MIKQKKSKKDLQKNPNQLELDFSEKEVVVDIKLPRASVNTAKQQSNNRKRLAIQLAEN
ncbi:Hypothetical protein IALB_3106 [Ignavibacterium album JCM 16511]|uniref:Uncharacterized protein n=1 Tax=Ignavibacterium album (strain DSM 19864 / JCM 16511 / NBRC 101810 / Mat9-16) TaxID=945713 RepID=I0APA2_IGNAJ|nr:hypothetical protein [Ignavibacterium album]AFH50809.1 Hypothetical protein IALB_3106 [Ignavibacterium album JCM 16511]